MKSPGGEFRPERTAAIPIKIFENRTAGAKAAHAIGAGIRIPTEPTAAPNRGPLEASGRFRDLIYATIPRIRQFTGVRDFWGGEDEVRKAQ